MPGTVAFDPKRLLIVWVAATTLPSPSATVTWVVWGAACRGTPAPYAVAFARSMSRRRAAVLLRSQAGDRHVHERGIAGRRIPVDEADLERFGEQVNAVDGPESERCDVVAFENVEELDQVDAATGGRRAAGDLVSAIRTAHGHALDRAIGREIVERDDPTLARHVLRDAPSERTAVERRGSVLRDIRQGVGIRRLHEKIALAKRDAVRQERPCRIGEEGEIGGCPRDALGEISGHAKAVRRMADRRSHDPLETHRAEAHQHLAPRGESSRNPDGAEADRILAAVGLHVIRPDVGDRAIHVGTRGRRRRGVSVER